MKRMLFVFIPLLFAACVNDVEFAEKGGIAGIVTDKTVGEPIGNVEVTLTPSGNRTITGSDGAFQFSDLEEGNYTISITKDGYKTETTSVVVFSGKTSECHLLIERRPAVITADREVLEFGEQNGVTQLSVSIVNPGYSNLEWSVTWDSSIKWILAVEGPDGQSGGVLGYGKTASLIVRIDRDALNNGYNEAVIVIWSDNGRSELKVTATGADRRAAVTTVLPATNVDTQSATLHAEVLSVGSPEYFERGFVISKSSIPEDDVTGTYQKVSAQMNENTTYSVDVTGLEKGVQYYVRAYAKNDIGFKYSSNEVDFTTIGAITSVSTKPVSNIDPIGGTALFQGYINVAGSPSYTEKGFVYNTTGEPTVNDKKVKVSGNAVGEYSYTCAELAQESTFYVRAYAIQLGKVYYGTTVSFNTNTSTTSVSTSAATDVTTSSATLNGAIVEEGLPVYVEKGFCYGTSYTPTIKNNKIVVSGTGEGNYSSTINGLNYNTTYYYRAYAIQNGEPLYGPVVSFTTTFVKTVVETKNTIKDITYDSAKLYYQLTNLGDPKCTQVGICYSTSSSPTVGSNAVYGLVNFTLQQSSEITGLRESTTYYYRAFAIQDGQTIYGATLSFKTGTRPSVSTRSASNLSNPYGFMNNWSVELNGYVNSVGDPKITQKGFKYSYNGDPEDAGSSSATVSGSSTGAYTTTLTGLRSNTTYYVRAFVKNSLGTEYGSLITFTTGD